MKGTAPTSDRRRALVAWGSKLGGTEGIARIVGATLEQAGFEVRVARASEVWDLDGYDAVIIGGALYANRWHADACKLIDRHLAGLRRIPVWMFSSGPLDDSADRKDIPPPTQVAVLMERIGALGHVTFGGRLPADAKGFPAAAMAKAHAGDWRNPERIRAWATGVANMIPEAKPGVAIDHPGRSLRRLVGHGLGGWAILAAGTLGLMQFDSVGAVIALRCLLAALIFTAIAVRYFAARGAREALPTAFVWTLLVAAFDAALVLGAGRGAPLSWASDLPLFFVFLATWIVGFVMSMRPWPKPEDHQRAAPLDGPGGEHDPHHA